MAAFFLLMVFAFCVYVGLPVFSSLLTCVCVSWISSVFYMSEAAVSCPSESASASCLCVLYIHTSPVYVLYKCLM